jgi:hypothetical protein
VIDRLARFLSAVSFHRGLALGAMVGAAIAGSTLWARIRPRRGDEPQPREDQPAD